MLPTTDPRVSAALQACVAALRRIAEYRLEPALDEWLRELGERKEFLRADEYAQLKALVAFTEQRTVEKLEAGLALRRLLGVCPELGARAQP